MAYRCLVSLLGAALWAAAGISMAQDAPPAKPPAPPPAGEWRSLYDGKTLADWKETPFVAKGKVSIQDGSIVLGTGFMTGVNWTKDFPKANYEVRYEAARLQGNDFFGAITFPVHDSYCSLIVGGWGGMLVGLSSLDTMDASENETTTMHLFNQGQWYSFRLQVTDYQIDAWIDDEQVISVSIVGREVSLRPGEIEKSVPLGFASFSATGALRKIEYRLLPADAAP